jgi:hypothetical protein
MARPLQSLGAADTQATERGKGVIIPATAVVSRTIPLGSLLTLLEPFLLVAADVLSHMLLLGPPIVRPLSSSVVGN